MSEDLNPQNKEPKERIVVKDPRQRVSLEGQSQRPWQLSSRGRKWAESVSVR